MHAAACAFLETTRHYAAEESNNDAFSATINFVEISSTFLPTRCYKLSSFFSGRILVYYINIKKTCSVCHRYFPYYFVIFLRIDRNADEDAFTEKTRFTRAFVLKHEGGLTGKSNV
jgi:hypothetical protein